MAASLAAPSVRAARGWTLPPLVSRLLQHRLALVGILVLVCLVLACVLLPGLLAYNQLSIDIRHRFAPPLTGAHWLGTDQLGRDLLARLLIAGRISMATGLAAMVVSMGIGVLVGSLAGYYRGWVGAVLMRLVDAMLCFPRIFLVLTLSALVRPSPTLIAVVIAVTSWMEVARIVEAQIRALSGREFAMAADMMGASNARIIFSELLPNAMGPIIVAATLNVAHAILAEAAISYLGYGIQPPTPSWGNMLNNAQQYLGQAPWLAIFPGLMITASVVSFNFLGDGLQDALDPKRRKR